MLSCTVHSAQGPVTTTSPELLLAVSAVLDQPRRATERDLIEALMLSLEDRGDNTTGTTAGPHSAAAPCRCCAPLLSAAG